MQQLKLWQFLLTKLEADVPVVFMCVLESNGSSPGRQGFKMGVAENEIVGSIGGGIMEHKLVELAKEKLSSEQNLAITKKQIHQKSATQNQSGMICSGEQTIFLYLLQKKEQKHIEAIIDTLKQHKNGLLQINSDGFCFYEKLIPEVNFRLDISSAESWEYEEKLGYKNHVYIIGGGHCSLALSGLMRQLDFYVHVFDERKNLNTMTENTSAHHVEEIKNFENIKTRIPDGNSTYVVIMTFGYRSDGIVIRALLAGNYRYIGMLGSQTKIDKLREELRLEGFPEEKINAVFAPIGLQIKSQTPEEIAVSIAAEIIKEKNYMA